ncbi:unnamed protein product [Closterium sp. Naga37s-1]|nr:unnamed protein product [Closterium sp. Naga37s-1]
MERLVVSSCALPCSAASAAASAPMLAAARFIPSSLHSGSTRRVHCNASAGNADGTGSSDDKGEGEGGEETGKERGRFEDDENTDKRSDDAVSGERKDKVEDITSGDVFSEDESADIVSSLGDWREFRARLIRGEVGVAGEEPGASGATDGGDALTGSTSTAGDLPSLEDVAAGSNAAAAESAAESAAGAGAAGAAGAASGGEAGGDAEAEERRSNITSPLPSSSSPSSTSPSSSPSSPSSSSPKSWAHPIAVPETGCVLLAHPRAFGVSQQYFNRAVIFLLMHGPQGTAGVILNRPSQYTLGQLAGFEELLPEFSACPLYLGGDVGSTSTHCLHGVADLVGGEGGAREVCPGVYVGGYSRIKEHVGSGQSNSMDYRWFARYAGWAPGQLEREVAAGVWYLGACSPDLILRHSLRETITVESAGDSASSEIDSIEAAERGGQSSETGGVVGRREGVVGVSGNTGLWREVMELMGGEYALLCKQADGEL